MAAILIASDNASIGRSVARLLESAAHQVFKADSGAQALEMIGAILPDLLLIDLLMPPPGGYQLLQRLRTKRAPSEPQVIFLAAPQMKSETRLLAEATDIVCFVVDVTDSRGLLAAVEAALSGPTSRRAAARGNNDKSNSLYQLVSRLYQGVAKLKTFNTRLGRSAALDAARLEVARFDLKREVIKRLQTEQVMLKESRRLSAQSVRDPLTGLYNRSYLEESLVREESRAKRSGKSLGMMMIEIDHFTRYNDTFGFAAGDTVLRAVSRCMEALARREDILCRYGGDEFVLLMADTAPEMLRQRADMLCASVSGLRIEHEQRSLGSTTLSVGVASFPGHGDSAQAVLLAADAALYRAKTSESGHVVVSGNTDRECDF